MMKSIEKNRRNENVLISIVIPTYKPQKYFSECLNSIAAQTINYEKFEVIIILNGCDDPWLEDISHLIVESKILSYIKLIQTDIPGVSNARNIGINESKGEYITFIDDDDFISPTYLEELLSCSSVYNVGLSDVANYIDGNIAYDNIHHKQYLKFSKKTKPSLFNTRSYFNGPCMKMIHRDIIGDRRFDVHFKNGEDSLFMAFISDRIKSVKFTSKNAIYYRRIRPNSATTSYRPFKDKFLNIINIDIQILKFWRKNINGYNFIFIISRFAASLKSLIMD